MLESVSYGLYAIAATMIIGVSIWVYQENKKC